MAYSNYSAIMPSELALVLPVRLILFSLFSAAFYRFTAEFTQAFKTPTCSKNELYL